MALPIIKDNLVERLGAAEVARMSRDSDSKIDSAIEEAWDSARSAALNFFTAASWDAMTASTLPPEARKHIVSLACANLSSAASRPPAIADDMEEAQKWLSYLAGNKVRCFDSVLAPLTATTGSAMARVGAPARLRFDADDPCSALRRRTGLF